MPIGDVVATTDYAGVAVLVAALSAAIVSIGTFVRAGRIHNDVKTMNESALGELGAAAETRRVEAIPRAKRTVKEQRHVDEAPPADPPQGPAR